MANGGQSPWTDQEFLRSDQYRTDRNLRARQAIYEFQRPRIDLPKEVVDLIGAEGKEAVVDVGCGNGRYLAELKRRRHAGLITGVDTSPGMLAAARSEVPGANFACGDATALPLATGCADLVLAMHMLYHVPLPELAVAELRRVTAAGGRAIVGLNGEDHLQELRAALQSAGRSFGLHPGPPGESLRLANGQDLMLGAFKSVLRHDFVGELVLSDPGVPASYVRSTIRTGQIPEEQQSAYVVTVLDHLPVSDDGRIRIKTHSGCLICS